MSVRIQRAGAVITWILDRPDVRNAVDRATADALADAVRAFESDETASVAVLTGAGGHFCAGADLKAVAAGEGPRVSAEGDAPLGPTRRPARKPVIAAIEGYAVAGGLELACWADLRVVSEAATLGVFCRRFGVPLIDGGTVRLSRLIGLGRALDLVLTGRAVTAAEAHQIGLATRVVPAGTARQAAEALAAELAALPQTCLRSDRASLLSSLGMWEADALADELSWGLATLASGETVEGAAAFAAGAGRGGRAR